MSQHVRSPESSPESTNARWTLWMDRAVELASDPRASRGENPRVGCVILDSSGGFLAEGFHAGAGTPHAEVVALQAAGRAAAGGTAIITLEPCRHTGRTGPCTKALIDAGIARVVYAQSDPTDAAGGGAGELRAAGIEVVAGIGEAAAREVNAEWTIAVTRARPFVTAKLAISLDGRVAGYGGRRVQLTGAPAQRYAHELRARVQAVITGTGTVLADDPSLTVREVPVPPGGQPLRVIAGRRSIPQGAKVLDEAAPTLVVPDHDPSALLDQLYARGVRHALLEAGPTLLRAFLEAGCVDRLDCLLAGVWLGSGPRGLPAGSRLDLLGEIIQTRALGQDVLIGYALPTLDPGAAADSIPSLRSA